MAPRYPFEKVAVATDFGSAAARAVDLAVDVARRYDAELVLLHVVEPFVAPYPVALLPDQATLDAVAAQELDKETERVRAILPRVSSELIEGNVATSIIVFAMERDVDLLVLGTYGRRGPSRWILGSVAEKIVRSVHVPVLTVRGDEE